MKRQIIEKMNVIKCDGPHFMNELLPQEPHFMNETVSPSIIFVAFACNLLTLSPP